MDLPRRKEKERKHMIIGMSGKKGSGKNQVGEFIKDSLAGVTFMGGSEYERQDHAVCLALADPIKQISVDYFGVPKDIAWGTQEQKENTLTEWRWEEIPTHMPGVTNYPGEMSVRELLQWIGTELFRQNMHNDFWIKATLNLIEGKHSNFKHHVITDVRFPNEIHGVREAGGVNVRMWRKGLTSTDQHASETSLDHEDLKLQRCTLLGFGEGNRVVKIPESLQSGFDYVIINDGTLKDLAQATKDLIASITEDQRIGAK
jgi:hypothetical protein